MRPGLFTAEYAEHAEKIQERETGSSGHFAGKKTLGVH